LNSPIQWFLLLWCGRRTATTLFNAPSGIRLSTAPDESEKIAQSTGPMAFAPPVGALLRAISGLKDIPACSPVT